MILAVSYTSIGDSKPRAYFSSNSSIEQTLLETIRRSRQSIDVALYHFTSQKLLRALIESSRHGVRVRLLLDGREPLLPFLKAAQDRSSVAIRVLKGRRSSGAMHHKFAVFDGRRVATGSYNWTQGARRFNFENSVFIEDAWTVQDYEDEFDRLWHQANIEYRSSKASSKRKPIGRHYRRIRRNF